jgi:hypothetical protein
MKVFLSALLLSFGIAFATSATALTVEEPKTKKVCKETKDAKGKSKEVCKTIKIHKKHEGTKVPEKKK